MQTIVDVLTSSLRARQAGSLFFGHLSRKVRFLGSGICGHDLSSAAAGRYRLVGDMTIADERDLYKSANEVTR